MNISVKSLPEPPARVVHVVLYRLGTLGRFLPALWACAAVLDAEAMLGLVEAGSVFPAFLPAGTVKAGGAEVPWYQDDQPADVLRRLKKAGAVGVSLDAEGQVIETESGLARTAAKADRAIRST